MADYLMQKEDPRPAADVEGSFELIQGILLHFARSTGKWSECFRPHRPKQPCPARWLRRNKVYLITG